MKIDNDLNLNKVEIKFEIKNHVYLITLNLISEINFIDIKKNNS